MEREIQKERQGVGGRRRIDWCKERKEERKKARKIYEEMETGEHGEIFKEERSGRRQQVILMKFKLIQSQKTEGSWTMAIASCSSAQEKHQRN